MARERSINRESRNATTTTPRTEEVVGQPPSHARGNNATAEQVPQREERSSIWAPSNIEELKQEMFGKSESQDVAMVVAEMVAEAEE
jgi:hypothetical protein